ncbi:MAG: hypothetical protein MJA30_12910 [Cytophagales bacterium]|nr:hypothetical protein [Cytophagales bacterium]
MDIKPGNEGWSYITPFLVAALKSQIDLLATLADLAVIPEFSESSGENIRDLLSRLQ